MGVRATEPAAKRGRTRRKGWTEQQSVVLYRFVQLLVALLFRFWIRSFAVVGAENVPAAGGAFLIANHTSALDPFILGHAVKHRMLRGPGKIELFKNPVVGYVMRRLGIFPIRQEMADAAAVRTMVELYRNGRIVIVYPEGGRSPSGEVRAFFPDFARLVIRLKARIVPAGVAGAGEALPIGQLLPQRKRPIAVAFGEPFELSELYGQELTSETVERAVRVMESRVRELLEVARKERAKLNA
jgi:1-acyl-sn-glycerol-3-phosphate acyltransferase